MRRQLKTLNKFAVLFFLIMNFNLGAQTTPPASIEPEKLKTEAPAEVEAGNNNQEKIIYEYKKEDYFDFEALSVKGELLTPGDLSSKAVKRVKFNSKEYIRKNFDDYIEDDLMEIY